MVDFGKRLRELRKQHGLTQQQVADRVWVSKALISSYELSNRLPSYEVLIKLAKLFDVTTDYLLGVELVSEANNAIINADGLSKNQVKLISGLVEELRNRKV